MEDFEHSSSEQFFDILEKVGKNCVEELGSKDTFIDRGEFRKRSNNSQGSNAR